MRAVGKLCLLSQSKTLSIKIMLTNHIKILLGAVVAKVITTDRRQTVVSALANQPNAIAIARSFYTPQLVRELRKKGYKTASQNLSLELDIRDNRVLYQQQHIGDTKTLYKSPLPGELQAKLAYESIIDRFLEYLQKVHQIIALQESDYHVQVFIPATKEGVKFEELWQIFIETVAFSTEGYSQHKLPDLIQTFILMLNTVTLAGRGFSTLDIPIITKQQGEVIAAWYFAVIKAVEDRQIKRQKQIDEIAKNLANPELSDKGKASKENDLKKKEEMQTKEAKKYNEKFEQGFIKFLNQQQDILKELATLDTELDRANLTKAKTRKLQKQKDKLTSQVIFTKESVEQKLDLFRKANGDPFEVLKLDQKQNPDKFKSIYNISKFFTKTATDQINSTRGDIFTQCITEMYRLLENEPTDSIPEPLLSEQPRLMEVRSAGDDGKDFCYSCGVALNPKISQWKVARFMFERPSQRRQSSSSEDRPYICHSCSSLAFASPLKLTDENIILRLDTKNQNEATKLKLKDYLRMLTTKELHLNSGRHISLSSDRTSKGDLASQKLGKVQYALVKVASIFPVEVLTDFDMYLNLQGSEKKLETRQLIFIKGLMEGYGQSIINAGKDINLKLGDAVRYVEQDLPYLADYTLVKESKITNRLLLEQIRERYANQIDEDTKGDNMSQSKSKAQLYRDVAALTGLTYAFAQSLESTVRNSKKRDDKEREVSKLIEKVNDPVAFCYYATLGDESKTSVQARLYHSSANYFIYESTKKLLETLDIDKRESEDEKKAKYLQLYADDINRAYTHFAENGYSNEKEWNELTYNLKLSLYTRFPELVRKLKSTSEK